MELARLRRIEVTVAEALFRRHNTAGERSKLHLDRA
jgi:hypothetical protein